MSLFERYYQADIIWPVNPFKKCVNKYSYVSTAENALFKLQRIFSK
jgi:hypothetical protein